MKEPYDFSNIFSKLRNPDRFVLTHLSLLADFKEPVRSMLAYLYNSKDGNERKMATLLNAIYTGQLKFFLISELDLSNLLKKDKNQKRVKSVSGTTYKNFIHYLLSEDYIVRHREPTRRKSAVSELIYPDLLKHLQGDDEIFKKQKEKILQLYDQPWKKKQRLENREKDNLNAPEKSNSLTEEKIEQEVRRIQEKVNERKRRKSNR